MLEAISIQNFQVHKKKKYKLQRITTFTGPSDSGKSSIIRALGWLAFNRPRGTDFIREGVCSVAAKVDGTTVARRRGKSVNEYRLGKESFKAIGSDVPEQIASILKMDPEINLQQQHDVPFWVGLSSAEVARRLNKVADLEVIDSTLAALAAKTRDQANKEKVLVDLLVEVDEQLQKLDGVDDLDALLKKAEDKEAEAADQKLDEQALQALLISIANAVDAEASHDTVYKEGKRAYAKANKAHEWSGDVNTLSTLLDRLQECIDLSDSVPCFEAADAAVSSALDAESSLGALEDLLGRIEEHKDKVEEHSRNASKGEQWLEENVSVCPECGREL